MTSKQNLWVTDYEEKRNGTTLYYVIRRGRGRIEYLAGTGGMGRQCFYTELRAQVAADELNAMVES